MEDVVVLGGSGMLGSMAVELLVRSGMQVSATVRSTSQMQRCRQIWPMVTWRLLDCERHDNAALRTAVGGASWVLNAIGLTKPYLDDSVPGDIRRGIRINSLLPYQLGIIAEESGARVLQICTDSVYTGSKGSYVESDLSDATDVYGRTKSLGEVRLPNVHCLRCAIVGPELEGSAFILEWFRRQPRLAKVIGYANHYWNGLTTLHFVKLCIGLMTSQYDLPYMQHVIPADVVSEAELLHCFAREFGRRDVIIEAVEAETNVDRTLATSNEQVNRRLWDCAGYPEPPTVNQMITELANFESRTQVAGGHHGAQA